MAYSLASIVCFNLPIKPERTNRHEKETQTEGETRSAGNAVACAKWREGSKPPQVRRSPYGDTRSFPGNGQMIVSNPSIKRAMLWTALFVLFLIIITIFEIALR